MYTRLNLEATGLDLNNFPSQPLVTEVEHYGAYGPVVFEGTTIYTDILKVTMYNGRFRRVFVSKPPLQAATPGVQGTRSAFVIALPGSNSNGNGAFDLITGNDGYQYQWPLAVAKDNNMIAVMIDGPLWGEWEYPEEQDNPYDVLVADICAVEAARWFCNTSVFLSAYGIQPVVMNCFVGGISWGGNRAMMLSAALKDCVASYIAGGQMHTSYYPIPAFNPPEWAVNGYNYEDVIKNSNSRKTRIMFGGNGSDYLYTPFKAPHVPDVDVIVDDIVASNPLRFTKYIAPGLGHQIDLADIRSFFNSAISPELFYTVPQYSP